MKRNILIVEDDKLLGDLLVKRFMKEGDVPLLAVSGEEALRFLENQIPDAITLDILLPGMNGFEFLAKVKATPAFEHIPVVILSNLSQEKEIQKAAELKADKFLLKASVELDEVVAEVEKAIQAGL